MTKSLIQFKLIKKIYQSVSKILDCHHQSLSN